MDLWQRKLLAYLHDPPSKAFNLKQHHEIAESLLRELDFSPDDVRWFFDRVCDHTAAAADRVAFPKPGKLSAAFRGDGESPFRHPLGGGVGGGEYCFASPVPDAAFAERTVATALKRVKPAVWPAGWSEEKCHQALFFLVWRFWPEYAAAEDGRVLFVPADTRLPDHSIWTHCSVVSALQRCVEITQEGPAAEIRRFAPAFLLFQLGPVQEFIAQARPTRDLWSGSYLLSWIMAHAMKAVTDAVGPDCVLFPSLRGQPLFDLLHRSEFYEPLQRWPDKEPLHLDDQILTPTLPNRFLVLVPSKDAKPLAEAAGEGAHNALWAISQQCLDWLAAQGCPLPDKSRPRWQQQVRQFLQITWQTWEWLQEVDRAIDSTRELPMGKCGENGRPAPYDSLHRAFEAARQGMPKSDLDHRNYKSRSWKDGGQWHSELLDANGRPLPEREPPIITNRGFAWAAHYIQTDFRLAARRNTRDFQAWGAPKEQDKREGARKDVLSGKEEAVGDADWMKKLAQRTGHLFKADEQLGAINLIKRVWHIPVLQEKYKLSKRPVRFDSLPAVAAAKYADDLLAATVEKSQLRTLFTERFGPAASEAGERFGGIKKWEANNERDWVDYSDNAIFHLSEWDAAIRDARKQHLPGDQIQKLQAACDALKALQDDAEKSKRLCPAAPPTYVAVLALDGDSMGLWVSGARSPSFREQLAREAIEYFEAEHGDAPKPLALRTLLEHPRHLSPSYHLQFSECLANFSLYLARYIVSHFHGQMVFSGGDDVLAVLPAEQALPCARALRMAFRGSTDLRDLFPGVLKAPEGQDGFVALDGNWRGWRPIEQRTIPRGYHLLVPGRRADVSVGLAIGHMHSPLQNLVEAARRAEQLAKKAPAKGGYDRSAFVVSLFKRSGETIAWGANWDDSALGLAESFAELSSPLSLNGQPEARILSAKFPYALAGLLRPYALVPGDRGEWRLTREVVPAFQQEFAHVCRQQVNRDLLKQHEALSRKFDDFRAAADSWLRQCLGRRLDDFLGPFLTTTFIRRGED
jgi:CRISPR-associated protein Cmr2